MQGKNIFFENDLSLWNSFLTGDVDAYELIYKQHVQYLFSYGMSLTSNRELVKDCIHDIFIRIYNNRNKLGQTNNIRLYLQTALRNTLFNEFKKLNSHQCFDNIMEVKNTTEDIEDNLIERENEIDQKERIDVLKTILTHRQQEIIHYRFVEELGIEDISKLLNINYQSVANIIQRALKKMRKFYLKIEYKKYA